MKWLLCQRLCLVTMARQTPLSGNGTLPRGLLPVIDPMALQRH